MQDALERLPEAARAVAFVRNLIVRTLVLDGSLAVPDLPYDLDVFANPDDRVSVPDTVPTLDDLRTGGSDTEEEPTAGELIDGRGRHRGHRGGARRHLHDARRDLDLRRLCSDPHGRRDRVRTVCFRRPDRIEAGALRFADEHRVDRDPRARIADVESESQWRFPRRAESYPAPGTVESSLKRPISGERST